MKIAVIGTGIAGNVAAYHLAREHDITVFEADNRIGGHTNTVGVEHDGRRYPIDTGFIVFNERTYPNFIRLLDELGVAWQDSDMGFSVQHEKTGLEYSGSTLNTLFAQRSNIFRPSFHRMIREILRFNRESPRLLESAAPPISLQDYLSSEMYSREFIDHFIIPMGAAIWSAKPEVMGTMPAGFFIRFFQNHGMLSVKDRPVWRVIKGGSNRYVEKLVAGHRDRIRLNTPVEFIRRLPGHVEVKVSGQEIECFDQVFMACHGDQALRLLADPSLSEEQVLGKFHYQPNEAILHTDNSLMPRRRRAWAAWNYHIPAHSQERVAVSYNMNILQGIKAQETFCVTLNHSLAIRPEKIIDRFQYSHPVFTPESIEAQKRHAEINGAYRTYYCGAYWRNGFHEDGVVSALTALEHFKEGLQNEQRDFRRAG
ncbi:MAG: FAD-dependent oxidoreductase [Xanthomonadales bacterium]|nr:FAD-dependent oxidoreductase [Xanthomonadales bacterium]